MLARVAVIASAFRWAKVGHRDGGILYPSTPLSLYPPGGRDQGPGDLRRLAAGPLANRQAHGETSPLARGADELDAPTTRTNDLRSDPQPKPEPAVGSGFDASFETLENALVLLGGYADSSIANRDPGVVPSSFHRDSDGGAAAVLQSVAQ